MRNWWVGDAGIKTEEHKRFRGKYFHLLIPFKIKEDLSRKVKH